jgi:hypothetical protein
MKSETICLNLLKEQIEKIFDGIRLALAFTIQSCKCCLQNLQKQINLVFSQFSKHYILKERIGILMPSVLSSSCVGQVAQFLRFAECFIARLKIKARGWFESRQKKRKKKLKLKLKKNWPRYPIRFSSHAKFMGLPYPTQCIFLEYPWVRKVQKCSFGCLSFLVAWLHDDVILDAGNCLMLLLTCFNKIPFPFLSRVFYGTRILRKVFCFACCRLAVRSS